MGRPVREGHQVVGCDDDAGLLGRLADRSVPRPIQVSVTVGAVARVHASAREHPHSTEGVAGVLVEHQDLQPWPSLRRAQHDDGRRGYRLVLPLRRSHVVQSPTVAAMRFLCHAGDPHASARAQARFIQRCRSYSWA
jgi:hypothetical protein